MIIILLVLVIVGTLDKPVLYMNDDIVIRSILSGAYTGTPDGHVVYMQYPLSGVLAWFYQCFPAISWLEVFLACCILACMVLVAQCFEHKIYGLIFSAVFFLPYYCYMHYTVVAALVAGTAVFLLCGRREKGSSLILLWISYMIRKQVGLLCLPFVGLMLLWLGFREKKSCMEVGMELTGFCMRLVTGLLCISSVNAFCYSSPQWQEYLDYNGARTRLYDYTNFYSAEKYVEEYAAFGMTEEEMHILTRYYTMLDGRLNGDRLWEIAEVASENMWEDMNGWSVFLNCVEKYGQQIVHESFPYNYIWILAYLLIGAGILVNKNELELIFPGILGVGRSCIWLFLIWRDRFPERIAQALYIIELSLLLAMGMKIVKDLKAKLEKEELVIKD